MLPFFSAIFGTFHRSFQVQYHQDFFAPKLRVFFLLGAQILASFLGAKIDELRYSCILLDAFGYRVHLQYAV